MTADALNARLTDLEVKLSFAEDQVDELNRTVFRQQQQIDFLAGELRALRDQVRQQAHEAPRSLREEIPPHY
jgi:SlyX protein